jgi:phage terminase
VKKYDFTKKGFDLQTAYTEEKDAGKYTEIFKNYRDPLTKYAFSVLEGRVQAGYMIKLACFRHLQDLRRQKEDPEFKYHYDLNKARAILNFAKLVPDVNAGVPLPLVDFQKAILCSIVAWRDEKDRVRYVRATLSMARTNGKTYIAAILAAFYFLIEANDTYNRKYLFVAPTTDQSRVGFDYLRTMFRKMSESPAFRQTFKDQQIDVLTDQIISRVYNNILMRKSYESGQLDSFHYQFAVGDEVGDDKYIGKIRTGNGKITSGQAQEPNHVFLQISTAYPDSNSQFYKDQRLLQFVMERDCDRALDDNLCLIWEQDALIEVDKPETWCKSNPIMNLSPEKKDQMLKSLLSERENKMLDGSIEEFQNKSLNLWLQVKKNTYLQLDDVNAAIVPEEPVNIFGRAVYIGFDKSNFSDDTALVFVFPYLDGANNQRFYIKQHSWVPLARAQNNIEIKEKQDGINYRDAERKGYCDIAKNEYGYIDDGVIFNWLVDFVEKNHLDVQYFCYDQWGMSRMIGWIEQKLDWKTMAVKNVIQTLTNPTIDLRQKFDTREIRYLDDPIIKYSLKNAVLFSNNNGIKVDKEKATTKIDFVDALIDAWYTAMFHFDDISLEKKNKNDPFAGMSEQQINDYFTNNFSF